MPVKTSLGDRVSLASDVVLQVIGEDALLLKLDKEVVFALNATGARIAQLIGSHSEVGAIVAAMAEEYDVAAEAIAPEVIGLLDTLAARQLITRTPAEAPAE